MGLELEKMSRNELLQLRDDIDKALVDAEKRERKAALEAAEKAAAEFGFSLSELSDTGLRSAKSQKSKAKYRNPNAPEQTWTGRGRKPQWVHDALNSGTDIAELEI